MATTVNLTSGNDIYFNDNNNDGDKIINGGAGDDVFWLTSNYGEDYDTINGGSGYDTVVLVPNGSSNTTYDSSSGIPTTTVKTSLYSFDVSLENGRAVIEYAYKSIKREYETNDLFFFSTYSLTINGIEGIVAGAGNDSLRLITDDNVSRTIDGGIGDDQLFIINTYWAILAFNPALPAQNIQTLRGGDGRDNITVGGYVSASGDAGDDYINSLSQTIFAGSSLLGGDGTDTIFIGTAKCLDSYLSGGTGDDLITLTSPWGSTGNTLDGGSGNDTLKGAEGDDIFIGGSGNDLIFSAFRNAGITVGWTGNNTYQFGFGDGQDTIDQLD